MKYLKNRELFLSRKVNGNAINEVLQNDIAWGDSILGRMINSVLRKAKVGVNLVKIDQVISSLKEEFDKLISMSVVSNMAEEEKLFVKKIISSSILTELEKAVDGESDVNEIISITNELIKNASLNNNEDYKELVVKLKEFLSLIDKKKSKVDTKGESGEEIKADGEEISTDGEESTGVNTDGKSNVKSLDVAKVSKDNLPVSTRKFEAPKDPKSATSMYRKASIAIHPDKIKDEDIKSKANDLQAELNSTKKECDRTKNYDKLAEVVSKINDFLKNNKIEGITMDGYVYTSYMDFLLENDLPATIDKKDVVETKDDKLESTKEIFHRIFEEDYLKKWIISKEEVTKVDRKIEEESKKSTKVVIDGIDPIVEIVKLFNRAYKIHTTSTIPSGRKGGKVSNSVFNEYTYLGSGSGGTPESPGAGPWRNNVLFDKWENAVLDIIKDSKYQVLFNEDCTIKIGSADPRVNVTKKDGGRVQGGGKVLLTFINSMLDGSNLYKTGSQAAFIEKYFNVDVSKVPLGFAKDESDNSKNVPDLRKFSFKKSEIKEFNEGSIFSIDGKSKKNRTYYVCVLNKSEDGKSIFVAYSSSFNFLSRYASSQGDVSQGELPKFIKSVDFMDEDKNKKNYKTYLSKFPISKLVKNAKFNIKSILNSKDDVSPEVYEFTVTNLYNLVDDEGDYLVIKEEDLKKLKATKYDKVKKSNF